MEKVIVNRVILMDNEGSNKYVRKISCNLHKNLVFVEDVYCDNLGSHSFVAEDPSPLEYYALWTGNSNGLLEGL